MPMLSPLISKPDCDFSRHMRHFLLNWHEFCNIFLKTTENISYFSSIFIGLFLFGKTLSHTQETRQPFGFLIFHPTTTSAELLFTIPHSCSAMSFRTSLFRAASRRMATAAEALDKAATKGPKLPSGNDPSANHGAAHAIGT